MNNWNSWLSVSVAKSPASFYVTFPLERPPSLFLSSSSPRTLPGSLRGSPRANLQTDISAPYWGFLVCSQVGQWRSGGLGGHEYSTHSPTNVFRVSQTSVVKLTQKTQTFPVPMAHMFSYYTAPYVFCVSNRDAAPINHLFVLCAFFFHLLSHISRFITNFMNCFSCPRCQTPLPGFLA